VVFTPTAPLTLLLQRGHTYWVLPLANGDTSASWNFNNTQRANFAMSSQTVPTTWTSFPNQFVGAMEINGTPVPEPSTLTLFGLGSLGLLGFGWRRRKQASA
jgi:hypothetical protein